MESLDRIIESQILREEHEDVMVGEDENEFLDVLLATDATIGIDDETDEDDTDMIIDYLENDEN